jgi:hypothetical protein
MNEILIRKMPARMLAEIERLAKEEVRSRPQQILVLLNEALLAREHK